MYIEDKYPVRLLMSGGVFEKWEKVSNPWCRWGGCIYVRLCRKQEGDQSCLCHSHSFSPLKREKSREIDRTFSSPSYFPTGTHCCSKSMFASNTVQTHRAWPATAKKYSASVCCGGHSEKGGVHYGEPAYKIWAATPFLGHTAAITTHEFAQGWEDTKVT